MTDSLFNEGGPYNIKRAGPNKHTMNVPIPTDADGMSARECSNQFCSPAYFKVRPGTGVAEPQENAYCPYCRNSDEPANFATQGQIGYAKNIVEREAHKGINRMIQNALGLGPTGERNFGGGFVSVKMSFKPGPLPHVWPPIEEALRRDIACPHCGLDHAVFGWAVWCPDCGADIFLVHMEKEFAVLRAMLSDVERRREQFGARVAARDVENALEDSVSIFEAALRAITRRYLRDSGISVEGIEEHMKKVGNKFQNVQTATEVCNGLFGVELFEGCDERHVETLRQTFEKRHPITHNLGIVDRKYLERARSGELEGRDVRVTPEEIMAAIAFSMQVLGKLHSSLFTGSDNTVTGEQT